MSFKKSKEKILRLSNLLSLGTVYTSEDDFENKKITLFFEDGNVINLNFSEMSVFVNLNKHIQNCIIQLSDELDDQRMIQYLIQETEQYVSNLKKEDFNL